MQFRIVNQEEITMKTDVYQDVTNRIIKALESGTAPWLKPWNDAASPPCLGMPYNAASNTGYNGVNVLLLWIERDERMFQSDGWMTFKQAKKAGGHVKAGEKGTQIVLFKPLEITEVNDAGDEETKKIPLLRYFTVFNMDQIDGIEAAEVSPVTTNSCSILELAAEVGCEVRHGGNTACFIPSRDLVMMPAQDQFHGMDHYEATLAHELTHWTGGKARLDRPMQGRFGSRDYAFEELVAELGAAFICAQYGIVNADLRHDGYIEHWLGKLNDDKKFIFKASSHARQAVEWIGQQVLAKAA